MGLLNISQKDLYMLETNFISEAEGNDQKIHPARPQPFRRAERTSST